ncbi:uncharacterized protein LOC121247496 [Juglans microcarpa x Juglans regia]|uniref:uncharacterized protein LOC121247496 n=1 Tax=Juglans microcarpa x Juglans regia TaxID=2249226 RepID=UPI001B7DEA1D|nr:uncharacterized protein LOC121247496 [Juglans microcarpa x Juglans regia]
MVGNSHDDYDDDPEQQYSLDLKENDKFFSRLMAKETSAPNSSCRVLYYGRASSAVPFTWESQPGTPKHAAISESSFIPALQITPPPNSHYCANSKSKSNSVKKINSKPNPFYTNIFPKLLTTT